MTRFSGRSWGHALRQLPEGEQGRWTRLGYTCSVRGCRKPPTYEAIYQCSTGQRRMFKCDAHAATYAAKYRVQTDGTPATTATDEAVQEIADWMEATS
jgi:hypothetical protein